MSGLGPRAAGLDEAQMAGRDAGLGARSIWLSRRRRRQSRSSGPTLALAVVLVIEPDPSAGRYAPPLPRR